MLTREGALDAMSVEVEVAPGAPADERASRQKAQDVAGQIKSRLGVTCEVVVKAPGEVPRSQGKAVRVQGFAK